MFLSVNSQYISCLPSEWHLDTTATFSALQLRGETSHNWAEVTWWRESWGTCMAASLGIARENARFWQLGQGLAPLHNKAN